MVVFVCASGWGISNHFWTNLSALLSKHGRVCYIDSVAYSGSYEHLNAVADTVDATDAATTIVGIGHSLGAHKLSHICCDAVVTLQSFTDFFGYGDRLRAMRKRILEDMINSYRDNPYHCLESFVCRCFSLSDDDLPRLQQYISRESAHKHISQLMSLFDPFDVSWLEHIPLLCVYTDDDPIVPASIASNAFCTDTRRVCLKNDATQAVARHHALGFYQCEEVYALVMDFLLERGLLR